MFNNCAVDLVIHNLLLKPYIMKLVDAINFVSNQNQFLSTVTHKGFNPDDAHQVIAKKIKIDAEFVYHEIIFDYGPIGASPEDVVADVRYNKQNGSFILDRVV